MDTLNLAYPGCTGVYLANAGHLVAFYGKKTKPGAGLSLEQGMEAYCLVTEIPTWMGSLARYTVHAISTTEAQELVQGLKLLEKEYFRKVHLELTNRLPSLHLGQTNSSLSASAKPFVPLATSSITAMGILPPGGTTLPYTTDDDGFTTDATSPKKKKNRWGQWGKNRGHPGRFYCCLIVKRRRGSQVQLRLYTTSGSWTSVYRWSLDGSYEQFQLWASDIFSLPVYWCTVQST